MKFDITRFLSLYEFGNIICSSSEELCIGCRRSIRISGSLETRRQILYSLYEDEIFENMAWAEDKIILEEVFWFGKMISLNDVSFQLTPARLFENGEFLFICLLKFGKEKMHPYQEMIKILLNDKSIWLEILHHMWDIFWIENDETFGCNGILELLPDELLSDRVFAKRAVGLYPFFSEEIKDDKEIALELVKNDGYYLELLSDRLRDDKDVVIEAVKNNGSYLAFASERLKNDKEVFLSSRKNSYIRFASSLLRDKEEIVWHAVCNNGDCEHHPLYFASERIRHNRRFILDCYTKEPYLGDNDSELYRELEKEDKSFMSELAQRLGDDARQIIPEGQIDEEIERIISLSSDDFSYTLKNKLSMWAEELLPGYDFSNNIDFLTLARAYFSTCPERLNDFPECKYIRHLIHYLVSVNGLNLQYASDTLRDDYEIVYIAVDNTPESILYASKRLQKNDQIAELSRKDNLKITYFDILTDPRYESHVFSPFSTYIVEWDAELIPKKGDIRTIHIKGSFSCRIQDTFFAICHGDALHSFDCFSSETERIRFVLCRLIEPVSEKKQFIFEKGLHLKVQIEKTWTPEQFVKENMGASPIDNSNTWYSPYESFYNVFNGSWSMEGHDIDGVDIKEWFIYKDKNNNNHVILKSEGYGWCGGIRSDYIIGNMDIGNRRSYIMNRVEGVMTTLDGCFEYGLLLNTIYLMRYRKDDTAEITIPSHWRMPFLLDIGWRKYCFRQQISILEEAFFGCEYLEIVHIPSEVCRIESRAFLDCPNLRKIYIQPETEIMKDAFVGCSGSLTIVSTMDSKARKYAQSHQLPFECHPSI